MGIKLANIKNVVDLTTALKDNDTFANEKDLCDFIELNKERFCKDVLNGELVKFKREWYLNPPHIIKKFAGNNPRLDFYFELSDGRKVGVECKHPRFVYTELSRSLSQVLSYYVIAKHNGVTLDELYLITTQYDDIVIQVIREFNLPVRLFVFNKLFRSEIL